MATRKPLPESGPEPKPEPTEVDRKALRDEISRRYEHTLRRLGR